MRNRLEMMTDDYVSDDNNEGKESNKIEGRITKEQNK